MLDIILVKLIEALSLSNIKIHNEDRMIPNELIQKGVPNIVPFIKLPNVSLNKTTKPISLMPIVFKAIKETMLAKPKRIPKASGGINTFSIKFITIANEHKIAT